MFIIWLCIGHFEFKFHKDRVAGAGPLATEWLFGEIDRPRRRISSDPEPSELSNDQHQSPCQSTETQECEPKKNTQGGVRSQWGRGQRNTKRKSR